MASSNISDAPAAARLGAVHRGVGLAQHLRRRLGLAPHGDADRGRAEDLAGGDREGLLPDLGDALGDLERLLVGLDLGQHDELVAAQARHGVGGAHDLGQARADLDQQLVAGLVAERVVDRLEAVDVEQQHGHAEAEARGAAEGVLDAVEEQRAVGQAGERVVQRLVAHDRLRALAVERRGQQVGDRLQPLALLAGERADRGRVHADDAEGARAPADGRGGGGADPALAQARDR